MGRALKIATLLFGMLTIAPLTASAKSDGYKAAKACAVKPTHKSASAVPELDPSGISSAAALLVGGVLVAAERRRAVRR